jgi:N-methylhydantoinase A
MIAGADLTRERIGGEVAALRDRLAAGLEQPNVEVVYGLRYAGQSFELPVAGPEDPDPDDLAERFAAEHERRYGYRDPDSPVELVNIRVALAVPGPSPQPEAASGGTLERGERRARFDGEWLGATVLRGEPEAGTQASGPCIFELPEATLVLPPGWGADVDERGTIVAEAGR